MVLDEEGLPVVSYPNSAQNMVPATQKFYEAVVNESFTHDGDERLANANAKKKIATKILNIPFCAYSVHICTTLLDVSTDAFFGASGSRLIFNLIYSTARYAPVVTACIDAPVNQ